jgi:rhamnosyltransferase
MSKPERIGAIYTAYKPDEAFRARIDGVVQRCDMTIVVDNTPGGHPFTQEQRRGLTIIQDGVNKGLGTALNLGLIEARRRGCDAVVLFDQDSSPRADFIDALVRGLAAAGPRAVIGPLLVDDEHAVRVVAQVASLVPEIDEASCIATSGMCFSLERLQPSDRFTEDFFLDFVDFDWCWRLRKKGWRICRLRSLPMPHRLGLAQRQFLGLTYHVPAPYRHYFQFRDTLRLVTRSYVPAYSRIRLGLILLPKFFIYPFILDRGRERLGWMLRGIRDAYRAVGGAGAASDRLLGSPSKSP